MSKGARGRRTLVRIFLAAAVMAGAAFGIKWFLKTSITALTTVPGSSRSVRPGNSWWSCSGSRYIPQEAGKRRDGVKLQYQTEYLLAAPRPAVWMQTPRTAAIWMRVSFTGSIPTLPGMEMKRPVQRARERKRQVFRIWLQKRMTHPPAGRQILPPQ